MSIVPVLVALRRLRARPIVLVAVVLALVASTAVALAVSSADAGTPPLSQSRPATASSTENPATPASAAVDGDGGSRWSSAFSDPQWLQVDLGSTATITQVVLQWEAAYATSFELQTSTDASTWTTIYHTTSGTGGTQTLDVTGSGRYVRMYGTARATQYGHSLSEFQVYGVLGVNAGCSDSNAALHRPATASSTENGAWPASAAVDGDGRTRWSSAFSDPQWLQVDLGSPQLICRVILQWEAAYARAFQIQVSNDASTWTTVFESTTGPGGTQALPVSGAGRYVRVYGTARGTQYGYSLWEFAVSTAEMAHGEHRPNRCAAGRSVPYGDGEPNRSGVRWADRWVPTSSCSTPGCRVPPFSPKWTRSSTRCRATTSARNDMRCCSSRERTAASMPRSASIPRSPGLVATPTT